MLTPIYSYVNTTVWRSNDYDLRHSKTQSDSDNQTVVCIFYRGLLGHNKPNVVHLIDSKKNAG